MKYRIITFGCQMNIGDSNRIALALEKKGYILTEDINSADLVLINMCSVRQSAVDRVYGTIKNIKNSKIIVTGCILDKDKKKLKEIVDQVLDTEELTKEIEQNLKNQITVNIPIMTGCNNFCSYCVVPYTRGREKSRDHKEIICEIEKLVKNGTKEIWLLGQNVNSYSDIPFSKLLRKINEIPGKFWIRFTSSHPKDFSDDIIKAIKESEKITEYLNLPVQSGDDEILKAMNRPYTIKKYLDIIKKVKKEIPNICLSTDVIVGFPNETKEQFQNTAKLFEKVKYDMAYINKYSPRSQTRASQLEDNISPQEKKRRESVLNEILKKTALENNKKYIDKEVKALIDHKKNNDLWIGKTREYKTIAIRSKKALINKFIKAKVTNATSWGLKGEYVK